MLHGEFHLFQPCQVDEEDGGTRAGVYAFSTTVAACEIDVRGFVRVDANDGAHVAYQARLAGFTTLANFPIDFWFYHRFD